MTLEEALVHFNDQAENDNLIFADGAKLLLPWLQELEQFRKLFKGTCREQIEEALEEDEALSVFRSFQKVGHALML